MCENVGIRANLSQARNRNLYNIIELQLNLGIRGLKLAPGKNLESGPQFAVVCPIALLGAGFHCKVYVAFVKSSQATKHKIE